MAKIPINIKSGELEKEKTIIDLLSGVISPQSYLIGRGIGAELKNTNSNFQIIT